MKTLKDYFDFRDEWNKENPLDRSCPVCSVWRVEFKNTTFWFSTQERAQRFFEAAQSAGFTEVFRPR